MLSAMERIFAVCPPKLTVTLATGRFRTRVTFPPAAAASGLTSALNDSGWARSPPARANASAAQANARQGVTPVNFIWTPQLWTDARWHFYSPQKIFAAEKP